MGHFLTCYPCTFSLCGPIPKHSVPEQRWSCSSKWLTVHEDCHTRLASARNLGFLPPLFYHISPYTNLSAV